MTSFDLTLLSRCLNSGYGNTAPTTYGGQVLVITGGFVTIVSFLVLNTIGAREWQTVVEDMFLRRRLRRLVRGKLSLLFWFSMIFLWLLFMALVTQVYREKRTNQEISLHEAYWFSYITTTTVGFGDIYIKHEEFTTKDMFLIFPGLLIGFNFVGIFATKLMDVCIPFDCGLKCILDNQREREAEGSDTSKEHEEVTDSS